MKAIIIVALLGVAAMMSDVMKYRKALLPIVIFGLLSALGVLSSEWNHTTKYYNDMLFIDNFSVCFSFLLIGLTLLWMLIGQNFMKNTSNRSEHAAMILFALIGGLLMVSFWNLTTFFVGLEILSISLYVLAASNKTSLYSNEAGMKYLLMGSFATGFLLFGIALLYGAAASFNMDDIAKYIADANANNTLPTTVKLGVIFILIGMLFKVSAVPFHFWTPDVYHGAPIQVTAFMATVVKTAAFAAFYRMFSTCFVSILPFWSNIVAVIAGLTMVFGNVMALYQKDIKRMLAYSSIAHAGYLLMAVVTLNYLSAGAILLYAVAYSVASLGAFALLEVLQNNKILLIDDLKGLAAKNKHTAFVIGVLFFSLAGIPPLAGFFAKYYMFFAALNGGYLWLVLLAVLASLIGVYYYLRVIYTTTITHETQVLKIDSHTNLLMALCAIIALVLGLAPTLIQSLL